ncbi:MAG TPA: nuclear transport factor 2 family protein [Chitinophagaceae bacterium]
MKKGLLALACMFMLLSCNDTAKDDNADNVGTAADKDKDEQSKRYSQNTREVYKAIETGDVSKLDSFIAKDVVDHEGNNGKDVVGLDSLKHYLGKMHTFFDGLKMEVLSEGTSPDGEYHFTMVRMRGKAKENPWGMPVGADIDDTGVDVVKVKDGLATEHWGFMSMKDIYEMMPPPGAPKKK